jgi:hypothetical protein
MAGIRRLIRARWLDRRAGFLGGLLDGLRLFDRERQSPMRLLHQPLLRLLAINLLLGVATAVLMLVGLLALDPHGLRDLILSDRSPAVALGLLLFGFIITFGSVVMGTAIMAIGSESDRDGNKNFADAEIGQDGTARRAPQKVKARKNRAFIFGTTAWD